MAVSHREQAEALDRRMRTLKKKIEETEDIFQKKKAGEALEPNQLTKLGTRKTREEELADLEKQRRNVLVAGGAELCQAFGVCSNCGVPAHEARLFQKNSLTDWVYCLTNYAVNCS
jgi:hypothetical protein